jgi:hypothetical protein
MLSICFSCRPTDAGAIAYDYEETSGRDEIKLYRYYDFGFFRTLAVERDWMRRLGGGEEGIITTTTGGWRGRATAFELN